MATIKYVINRRISRCNEFLDFTLSRADCSRKTSNFSFFNSNPKNVGELCVPKYPIYHSVGKQATQVGSFAVTPDCRGKFVVKSAISCYLERAPGKQNFLTSASTMVG